jgi:hypothetical protein
LRVEKEPSFGWYSDGRAMLWLPTDNHDHFPLPVAEPLARETLLHHGAGRNVLLAAVLKESTPSLMHFASQPGESYKAAIPARYVNYVNRFGAEKFYFGKAIDNHQHYSLLVKVGSMTTGLIMGQTHDGQARGLWEWLG